MAIPEKITEAVTQTQLTMKTFRKAMVFLLFEWQNLENRLELTEKCLNESFSVQESGSESSKDLGFIRLDEVEQKEKEFRLFQENGIREMEIREDKLGLIRKEINLREKRVQEQEELIQMEKKQLESQSKSIEEKEKRIKECLREVETREEELNERVKEFELNEQKLEMMNRDLELRAKKCNSKDKLNSSRVSAVFRIAGPSNQSMALVNASETSSGNQQISKSRLRSKAWQHFTKIAKGVGSNDKCECNHCHRIFTLCGGSTSQLLRHISEGRCSAYQKINSALPIDEMLSITHSQQSVDVQVEEAVTRPSNVGEDSRTCLIKGCEESVKQEPATMLLEQELQTRPNMEPQMAIPNNIVTCEYNYQPRQLNNLSKDQSDPSFNLQPPPGMGNSRSSRPLSGYSVTLSNSDYTIRLGDSDRYTQETQLRHNKGNSDINENAPGETSEELQMSTCGMEKQCCSEDQGIQNRKRERDHVIEQNASNNVFLHSDIEDLSSPLRKHCSSKLSTFDHENTEDVLHEVDPVSCIIPIYPAQELYGNMMNQKDLIHEGSMPE